MRKIITILLLLLMQTAQAQEILLHAKWNPDRVRKSLAIIKEVEPALFNEVILKSTIQAGEYPGAEAFCTIDEMASGNILWIMLGENMLCNWSDNMITATIYHEALHLQYWMADVKGRNWTLMSEDQRFQEHARIYKLELEFLKRINATTKEIAVLRGSMVVMGIL